MSLITDASSDLLQKRKKDRACDACRRRKTKCNGPWMKDNVCSNCTQLHKPCTYVEASKPRGPPKAYVTSLEDRLEALEALLEQISPQVDYSEELGPPVVRDSWKSQEDSERSNPAQKHKSKARAATSVPVTLPPKPGVPLDSPSNGFASHRTTHLFNPRSERKRFRADSKTHLLNFRDPQSISDRDSSSECSSFSSSDTEEAVCTSLTGRAKLSLRSSELDGSLENSIRFHGRTSTAGLVEATRMFKHMHLQGAGSHVQSETDSTPPSNNIVAQTRRPIFWQTPQWELPAAGGPFEASSTYLEQFPSPDLAETLIELYFRHSNTVFPLLHRPTYLRQWNDGLQEHNIWFAAVSLCIFAIASRWCDDKRVVPAGAIGEDGQREWKHAGSQWCDLAIEIHRQRKNLFNPACLFEVQSIALISMYLRGTSAHSTAWSIVSVGLRKSMDIGAHRKKVYEDAPNADSELWKRVFWHLVVFDRLGAVDLGRACGISEEDFDIDLPLEVDDEYWESQSGREPFKQPSDRPPLVCAFNQFIRLTQISVFAARTLYDIQRPRFFHYLLPKGKADIVKQLSSAMDKWLRNLPEHLRWCEKIEDPIASNQAAILATTLNLTRMLIYRSLISGSSVSTSRFTDTQHPLKFHASSPFLTTCTEAARTCAHILETQLKRGSHYFYVPELINVAYLCGGMLTLIIWDLKTKERALQGGAAMEVNPPVAQQLAAHESDLKIFLKALGLVKHRWQVAESLLTELELGSPDTKTAETYRTQSPQPDTPSGTRIPERYRDGHPSSLGDFAGLPIIHSVPIRKPSKTRLSVLTPFPRQSSPDPSSSDPHSGRHSSTPFPSLPTISSPWIHNHSQTPLSAPHFSRPQLQPHSRSRAFSEVTPAAYVSPDRSLPYISSSMRRTSVAAFPTVHNVAHQPRSGRLVSISPHSLPTSEASMRFDINMHPEDGDLYHIPRDTQPIPPHHQPIKHPMSKLEPYLEKRGVRSVNHWAQPSLQRSTPAPGLTGQSSNEHLNSSVQMQPNPQYHYSGTPYNPTFSF